MIPFKKVKKRNRSKSVIRRRKKRAIFSVTPSTGTYRGSVARPLGRSIRATHTYATRDLALDPGVSTLPVSHIFSVNGLFDPDVTGIGTQPVGFDQMTPLFDHYTVIYANVTIDFVASGQASGTGAVVGVRVQDNTATSTDVMLLTTGDATTGIVSPAEDRVQLTRSVNLSKFLGRPHILSEDDCRGSSTSNPQEQAFFQVFAFPFPSGGNIPLINTFVRIDYVAIWTEPRSLGES